MLIRCNELDTAQIAESGQCFRMNRVDEGIYGLIYSGRYLEISDRGICNDTGDRMYELSCDEEEYNSIWREYLDIDTDYAGYMSTIDKDDEFLTRAAGFGSGIRILRQDPWEMLISFIISQRKSIPAIRTSVERLCTLCGDRIDTIRGVRYSFPDAGHISELTMEELDSCGLGYRSRYISNVSRMAVSGELDVYAMEDLTDSELKESLMAIPGVGVKVANCVMLFGYHRIESFPEDVWIKRALEGYYPEGFPYEKYPGCAGVMQQYIFFYSRNGHV